MNTLQAIKAIEAAEDAAKANVAALSDAALHALSNMIHEQHDSGEISQEQYDFVIGFVVEEACARIHRALSQIDAQLEVRVPMPEHSTTIH
jgi:hypothetical protein